MFLYEGINLVQVKNTWCWWSLRLNLVFCFILLHQKGTKKVNYHLPLTDKTNYHLPLTDTTNYHLPLTDKTMLEIVVIDILYWSEQGKQKAWVSKQRKKLSSEQFSKTLKINKGWSFLCISYLVQILNGPSLTFSISIKNTITVVIETEYVHPRIQSCCIFELSLP